MPDDDRLPRSLSRGWRRVLKAFRAGESQEEIAFHGLTVSCDAGFSARVPGHRPCGACTSCLLWFQSLTAAGLGDLVLPDGSHRRGDDRDFNVNAMLGQVTRLRPCLAGPEPWQRLVCEFPELLDVTGLANEEVVRLYRAYVEEWDTYEHAAWAGCLAGHGSGAAAL